MARLCWLGCNARCGETYPRELSSFSEISLPINNELPAITHPARHPTPPSKWEGRVRVCVCVCVCVCVFVSLCVLETKNTLSCSLSVCVCACVWVCCVWRLCVVERKNTCSCALSDCVYVCVCMYVYVG